VNILQQRVRQGIITDSDQLQAAYRQLSKHIHPDASGLHPSHFALLQADRDAAQALLERRAQPEPTDQEPADGPRSGASEPRSQEQAPGDFWQLFSRYISLGYPREAREHSDALESELIRAAARRSPGMRAAILLLSRSGRRPMGRELDVMPAQRSFFLGVENLIRYVENRDRRSARLAGEFLGELVTRVREKYYSDAIALYPAALLLLELAIPPGEEKEPADPFEELESLAMLRWKMTSPASWLDASLKFSGGPAGDLRHQLTALRSQIKILANAEAMFSALAAYAPETSRRERSSGMMPQIQERRTLLTGIEHQLEKALSR
jgi:hypothetical protein